VLLCIVQLALQLLPPRLRLCPAWLSPIEEGAQQACGCACMDAGVWAAE
jgi:hypothetical protein